MLYIGGAFGISQAYLNKGPVQVGKSLVDLEALRGGVIQVLEVANDSRFQYREEARQEGLRSMLCVPVQAKSRVLGIIRVYSGEPHQFSEQEQNLLRNLANLGAVAIENARSYAELQSLNEEKVWFARMTHHQLRSPLAAIHGTLDALPFAGPLTDKQKELVERAQRRIQDAFSTIRDFLDLAAAQRPRELTRLRPIDLEDSLKGTLEAIAATAQSKHVRLTTQFSSPAAVLAEAADLDRIFSNLLDNAVKYTSSGGTVRFTVQRSKDGEVTATVSDTGIGIPEEEQERIFEGFYRTKEAKATGEIGTGLGLSIVRKLVERLGARLELESTPGKGTTFRVVFPRADEQSDQPPAPSSRAGVR
ncbi:MAG: GAF domain-containing sensor histidine kinase [Acidobacteriota bacterium]